jgi:hypothetical protein
MTDRSGMRILDEHLGVALHLANIPAGEIMAVRVSEAANPRLYDVNLHLGNGGVITLHDVTSTTFDCPPDSSTMIELRELDNADCEGADPRNVLFDLHLISGADALRRIRESCSLHAILSVLLGG